MAKPRLLFHITMIADATALHAITTAAVDNHAFDVQIKPVKDEAKQAPRVEQAYGQGRVISEGTTHSTPYQMSKNGEIKRLAPGTAALLAEIEKFLRKTGMAPTTFGDQALGDPSLVNNLRNDGRELRHRTLLKVRSFMANPVNHDRPRQAAHYIKKADKKKATARVIQHLSRRQPALAEGTAD